jgi:hypothetical protein
MKPQPGRMQPMLFNPISLWTDFALKTGEIMLASAHAVERKAKSGEFLEPASTLSRKTAALTRELLSPNGTQRRKPKSNGNGKSNGKARSAKRRARR